MRFRTRAFLICFIPFALLLSCSFWIIQRQVQSTVRAELRASLSANQAAISRIRAKSNLENNRFLKVAGEDAALKAGLQLLAAERHSAAARRTVEDQLLEMGEHMGFDFLLVSAPNGEPLAGVIRKNGEALAPFNVNLLPNSANGLLLLYDEPFQIGSVPLDAAGDNIGSIAVGERFDVTEFSTSAVLLHNGIVIQSSVPNFSAAAISSALKNCKIDAECNLKLRGDDWLSMPIHGISSDNSYIVRSLDNVDAAIAPVQHVLRRLFFVAACAVVIVALLCSFASARSIVMPVAAIIANLRKAGRNGVLPEFTHDISNIAEVRELTETYNRAAGSVRQARESLQNAYVEFVGSLAHALDARDGYTAGHSARVSDLSCAVAEAMNLTPAEVEKIRISALLHDIGKIGISDSVLQKPGRLTDEEFAMIKQHPVIGRRILEGVQGLAPYLPAVELHHENWDGTGYPKKQSREQVPLEARIIHVADAYDAMTTNRSYRRGMTREKAMSILMECAGTQFDPNIVALFSQLPDSVLDVPTVGTEEENQGLRTVEVA